MNKILLFLFAGGFFPMALFAQLPTEEVPLVVEEVRCQGNSATSCRFIASHLNLSAGDKMDEGEIKNAKLRLSAIPNFKSIDIHLEKGGEKGKAVVVIEVTEASPITKEFVLGTSLRDSSLSQKLAGRVSHQNLFGSGKILDLQLNARLPMNQPEQKQYTSRLQYTDPNLFGSKKYYLIAGMSYENNEYFYKNGDSVVGDRTGFDLSVGRHFGDFSYFSAGYQYRPISRTTYRYTDREGSKISKTDFTDGTYLLVYGANSEDDPYFPSSGKKFSITMARSAVPKDHELFSGWIAYRATWTTDRNTVWTFSLGGSPGTEYRPSLDEDQSLSIGYARPIAASNILGGIERGRWYVAPGFSSIGYSSYHGVILDPGLKVGIRLESKSLGIIDIYALGSTEMRIGASR